MHKITKICLKIALLAAIIAISTSILNPDLLGTDNLRNFFNTSDINLAINIAAILAVGLIVIAFLILIANETK